MDLKQLKVGTRLLLEDGSKVEVLAPSDGHSVRVKYVDSPFSPELAGTVGECTDYDILSEVDEGASDTPVWLA